MKPLAISVRQATEMAPIGKTTIYKLIKTGRLKTSVVMGRRLIDRQSFCELLNSAHDPAHTPGAGAGERLRTPANGKPLTGK